MKIKLQTIAWTRNFWWDFFISRTFPFLTMEVVEYLETKT